MTDEAAILTIAIPTYNRAAYLDMALASIRTCVMELDDANRGAIEIFVSDNASTDDTPAVVARYLDLPVGRVTSIRNDSNIGPDRNVRQCYLSADTPYVWILGDDDLILPGGIAKALSCLASRDADIVYLESYGYSHNAGRKPLYAVASKRTIEYADALDFARRTHVKLTYISAMIVRTKVSLTPYLDVLDDSYLGQFGWVLQLLSKGRKFVVIDDWIVAGKIENSGGYNVIKVFATNLTRIAAAILPGSPALVKTIQNGAIVSFFPRAILNARQNTATQEQKTAIGLELKKSFAGNWRRHVFLTPLLLLPLPLAKIYHIALAVAGRVLRRCFI